MGKLITQTEIMKCSGLETVFFPEGTIITPSAKDWAKEHGVEIVLGKMDTKNSAINISSEKSEILNKVVKSVIENIENAGGFMKKEEIAKVVEACLHRLGCTVN